jgi:hypothetical protein
VFASHAGATRFKNNTQQWPLSATNKSDGKVRYETTISTSIKVPDADQEMSFLLSEYETEGQGTETKSRQDNGNQFYLEVFIDKSRKHNNASGTQTSETHKMLPVNILGSSTATEERKVAKIYHGQVGLRTDLSIDETEEQAYRKQEKMRSTIVEKLIEEMFPDVAPDFSELLNVKGNYNSKCISFCGMKICQNKRRNVWVHFTGIPIFSESVLCDSACIFSLNAHLLQTDLLLYIQICFC